MRSRRPKPRYERARARDLRFARPTARVTSIAMVPGRLDLVVASRSLRLASATTNVKTM